MYLSIIIPMATEEAYPSALCKSLRSLNCEYEIIVIEKECSRAAALNVGAVQAKGEFLWFLHADSVIHHDGLKKLLMSLAAYPDRLHYFNLQFDSGLLMSLNSLGANIRSKFFKIPFGDQGLCIKQSLFEPYREDVAYGEDHLFIWQMRKKGILLQSVGAHLITSARKYQQYGWLQTTLMHHYLWLKQLIKEGLWRELLPFLSKRPVSPR